MRICLDCETVNRAYACCKDPEYRLNFVRYGETQCPKWKPLYQKEAERIAASVMSDVELQPVNV